MTERLREITARIQSVRQLGTVITAMRGVAAARAQQSRQLLPGVRAYAAEIAAAIAQALRLLPPEDWRGRRRGRQALVVFAAEHGFVGGFSDRVLEAAGPALGQSLLFVVGTRGARRCEERRLAPAWRVAMAAHAGGVPATARQVIEALYERIGAGEVAAVATICPVWSAGGLRVERHSLLPLDLSHFRTVPRGDAPLTTLPPARLMEGLAEEYAYAELCEAAMLAFVAENEARMMTMVRAKTQVEKMLEGLIAEERQVRQEDITAEVIELVGGRLATAAEE